MAEETKACIHCEANIPEYSVYCPQCTKKVVQTQEFTAGDSKSSWKDHLGTIAVIVVGGGFFLFKFGFVILGLLLEFL